MIQHIIFGIGLIAVLRFVSIFIWEIVKQFLWSKSKLDKYGRKEGKWAVVTGGTDGIGLGFCEMLSQMGWNVCIISRNQQKIKKTITKIKQDLQKQKNVIPQFKYIVADYKNCGNIQFFDRIQSQLKQNKIGILVNNVGTADIKQYEAYPFQQIIDTININCTSMAGMTSILLPKLKQGKSAIINLSSFLGETPAPYSTLYSGTKAFNTFFSESLSMESQYQNIDILSVKPMFVVSSLSRQKKSFTVPDRKQCAYACFKELGWEYQTNGYFLHRVMAMLARTMPKFITRPITKINVKKHRQIYFSHTS